MATRHSAAVVAALLVAVWSGALARPAAAAVVFGQLDDFQDGTTMAWEEGGPSPNPPTNVAGGPAGAGDRFLHNVSAGGGGAGALQVMFNRAQWAGNYNAAGVTRVQAQMRNLGATPLNMRVALNGAGRWFASTTPVVLEPESEWRPVSFDLTSASLTPLGGGSVTLAAALSNVTEFRILSATSPDFRGQSIASTLGMDNLRALRLPGDANFSGAVEASDFALLAGNFGRSGRSWNTGDFTFDGFVDASDFALLAANFGRTIPASAAASVTGADWAALESFGASIGASPVPEPAALSLLALTPLLARRARRVGGSV